MAMAVYRQRRPADQQRGADQQASHVTEQRGQPGRLAGWGERVLPKLGGDDKQPYRDERERPAHEPRGQAPAPGA